MLQLFWVTPLTQPLQPCCHCHPQRNKNLKTLSQVCLNLRLSDQSSKTCSSFCRRNAVVTMICPAGRAMRARMPRSSCPQIKAPICPRRVTARPPQLCCPQLHHGRRLCCIRHPQLWFAMKDLRFSSRHPPQRLFRHLGQCLCHRRLRSLHRCHPRRQRSQRSQRSQR